VSESAYWLLVRELVESGDAAGRPKHEIRQDIVHQVHAAYADGQPWASDVLTRWSESGADADYTRVNKDRNTVTYIRADGRRVRKTVAYSRPQRDVMSGAIVGRQMQAWWGMSRAAIAELRREMAQQADRVADVVAALDRLLGAMDRHPECVTAREAWEADGHDVGEIDLAEAS
jgi:hypothetical protein